MFYKFVIIIIKKKKMYILCFSTNFMFMYIFNTNVHILDLIIIQNVNAYLQILKTN